MSVKLHDLCVESYNGSIVICKKNKRGNVKEFIDISTVIVRKVVDQLMTGEGRIIYQQYENKETGEIEHYKITCTKMTNEEVNIMRQIQDKNRSKGKREASTMMAMMLGMFGGSRNRLLF